MSLVSRHLLSQGIVPTHLRCNGIVNDYVMLVVSTPTFPQSKLMHLAEARLFTNFLAGASLLTH